MRDVQSENDKRGLMINEVGISDLYLPIFISDKKNKKQQIVAKIKASVKLPSNQRGTHMSRFIEVIKNHQKFNFNNKKISKLMKEIRDKLHAECASLQLDFTYFINKKSPISNKSFLMDYQCKIKATISENNTIKKELEVEVPISSVCPCSKIISKDGAHNQRGLVKINVNTSAFVWIETLINIAEISASGVLYPILKREDEKYVTEKMFANPKFVEDIVRDIALQLKKDKKIESFEVECTNYESIHNHNAYAKIKS
ncbi:GTP cyclohydrolase I FolE2 [Candidatus Falkowbacteria bacterium]|nr:GTP cyclohydrolase I FolE2 [Candidatus Falkowbacteria bacterium]